MSAVFLRRFSRQRFMREGDWYASVDIAEGFVTFRTFDNLMAFWPGMQALLGESRPPACSIRGHPTRIIVARGY